MNMSTPISRSTFFKTLGALTIAAVSGKLYIDGLQSGVKVPCRMLGPSMARGHALRDGKVVETGAAQTKNAAVTIIGGGIAGLSAGWWLQKNGFSDFLILEMENAVGGNSSSGKNQISAYPWAAHYVPLANKESKHVHDLFCELGIIEGYDPSGLPRYNELYLCHDPQERLLKDGSFQEGLVPKRGLQKQDKEETARFFALMHNFRNAIGKDGKPAFAIPLDLSSQDPEFLKLDRMSMSQWLKQNQFSSKPLLWYVNYCCRDDYGSTPEVVSAWAGIHYFAGRRGLASNAEANSVVTWPEGNGFIVDKLKTKLRDHIITGTLVSKIKQSENNGLAVHAQNQTHESLHVKSGSVIFAAPRFLAKHVIEGYVDESSESLAYAPWLVANISLKQAPGASVAWDNVSYYSDSLGYVVATHQNITTRPAQTVITYYYPLSSMDPHTARKVLSQTPPEVWSKKIIDDLEKMHPTISNDMLSIDLCPWGHGMIRPSVGYIWGDRQKLIKELSEGIFFAHSDMSGISNFEEAQYQGIEAAKRILAKIGHIPHSA